MDCSRSQELISDHLEGDLHQILGNELEAHLAHCEECRSLHEAVAEVIEVLHDFTDLEPAAGLAERVAKASCRRSSRIRVP